MGPAANTVNDLQTLDTTVTAKITKRNAAPVDRGGVFVDGHPKIQGMASIRERSRKDGMVLGTVFWRDTDTGKHTSRTLLNY
ncbi:hypothetical protein ACUXGL_002091 [Kocuria marina]